MDFTSLELKWVADLFHKENTGTTRHDHTFFQILYVKSGSARVYINDQTFPASPASFFLFKPLEQHEFYADRGGISTFEMKFDIADPALHERLSNLDRVLAVDGPHTERILSALVFEADRDDELAPLSCQALFTELVIHLFRCQEKADAAASPGVPAPLRQVLRYMRSHYRENISLEELAAVIHVEKTYFIKTFKKHIGATPIFFLQRLKIEKAATLILNSDMSITGISDFLGFKSIHHFSNAFKKHTGFSPTAYKARNQLCVKQNQ